MIESLDVRRLATIRKAVGPVTVSMAVFDYDPVGETHSDQSLPITLSRLAKARWIRAHGTMVEDPDQNPFGLVFSPLGSENPYIEGLKSCMAALVVGMDQTTGQNVSQLFHFSPKAISTPELRSRNLEEARRSFAQFKRRTLRDVRTVIVIGGLDFDLDSQALIEFIKEGFRHSPPIIDLISEPKSGLGDDHIYFRNDTGEVVVIRSLK